MDEVLLINPAGRPRRKKARRTAAQRAATRKMQAANRARRNPAARRRRRNPAPLAAAPAPRRRRRRNPAVSLARYKARRRTNPSMLSTAGLMGPLRDAAIQGAGAVAFDVAHAQLRKFLPAMLQPIPGSVGLGDAAQAIITVMIGRALRGPTRGLSMRAASGALTVQAHGLIKSFVPATLTMGYAGAGMVGQGNARIGPSRGVGPGMGRYTAPGGATPLLSGSRSSVLAREGVTIR
jgi:hypothetical protein